MKITSALVGAALAAMSLTASVARASVTDLVNMTFQSGATFTGDVTFANNYSYVTDVTGTLAGGPYGVDSINWVWDFGNNFSSGTDNYSTFLMDGPGSGYNAGCGGSIGCAYSNFIQFAYNYSAAPVLTFTSGVSVYSTDNYVNYVDPMVSGSISAVPEPASWAMMLLGFAGLGFAGYRRAKKSTTTFAAA
jgi:hypothetical protein